MKLPIILDLAWRVFERARGVARPARVEFNCFKTAVQTLLMWLVFLGAGPFLAWHLEAALGLARLRFVFAGQQSVAVLLFIVCGAIALSSGYFLVIRGLGTPLPLDAPRRLVIVGPYRYVRNPMAMGSLFQGLAIGLGCGSPAVLIYVFAGIWVWNYIARPWEEFDLARRFGADYEDYRRAVRCWIPCCTPYRAVCKMESDLQK